MPNNALYYAFLKQSIFVTINFASDYLQTGENFFLGAEWINLKIKNKKLLSYDQIFKFSFRL